MAGTRSFFIAVVAVVAISLPGVAIAHGGSGGGSGSSGSGGATASGKPASGTSDGAADGTAPSGALRDHQPVCNRGYVVKAGNCVHASAGALTDPELYAQGRELALAGYYGEALDILDAVTRTDDAMVLTMRGFATRKLGHLDAGMALYAKALAIDPDNINTHEYMGEAYVLLAKPELALAELATVQRLCGGTSCEQYADLAEAIETGTPE